MNMYPKLGPVEVGEVLRFESSGDPDHDFIKVTRLTKKLIYVDDLFVDGPGRFSREHGALFDGFGYDAYAGRIRKLTNKDREEIKAMERVSNG